jgi:hypothetical protein
LKEAAQYLFYEGSTGAVKSSNRSSRSKENMDNASFSGARAIFKVYGHVFASQIVPFLTIMAPSP